MTPVQNVGIDDWAWRKHQSYGSILVNLDLHRVIDLLPDRCSERLSKWLGLHPEIVTISRDRLGLYAEGATAGAPQAQHVADRFHLVLNLSATMERVLEERSRELVLPPIEEAPPPSPPTVTTDAEVTAATSSRSQLRRQRRFERYEEVMTLLKDGHSQAGISRMLAIERKTVRRWLRRGQFPERESAHRPPPKVNEFAEFLQQRWKEGCHNASRLFRGICHKGLQRKGIDGGAFRGRVAVDKPIGA